MKVIMIGILTVIILIIGLGVIFCLFRAHKPDTASAEAVEKTWLGYKHYFIKQDGRVIRPKENDTVSEGQAYAMLRAVWMNDKYTFDRCYQWTENNLSRAKEKGDNLLAWHWKDGAVLDWMPASDADIDYALSLIFAEARWGKKSPVGVEEYGKKATAILEDISRLETFKTASGRIYLSPWILGKEGSLEKFPVNPSYYSPAHFRVFYKFSNDKLWLELADSTYYILSSLSRNFNGKKGIGLIPDWCSVDNKDEFYRLEGKSENFGWEAVRIPFRVAMDYAWFGTKQAKAFCDEFAEFVDKEWKEKGVIFCEYSYNGEPAARYENALFYSSYASALFVSGSKDFRSFLAKTRSYIDKENGNWFYQGKDEYYVNSLAWLADGLNSGMIKNLFKER